MMGNKLWRKALMIAVVAGISVTAASTGKARVSLAASTTVQITQNCTGGAYGSCTYAFSPSQVTVPAGSTITWTNGTNTAHTASSDSTGFDTGTISMGGQASVMLTTPGTYTYHCDYHPYMHGSITVTGAAATATSVPPSATSIPATPMPSATSVPPTAGPLATSTSIPPTATATLQPSPTATATTTTRPSLTVSASLAPKKVHPGGKLRLSIRTRAGAKLTMDVARPGARSVRHHAKAKGNGKYQSTIKIGKGARHGTLTAKITATLGSQTAHAVTRASIR